MAGNLAGKAITGSDSDIPPAGLLPNGDNLRPRKEKQTVESRTIPRHIGSVGTVFIDFLRNGNSDRNAIAPMYGVDCMAPDTIIDSGRKSCNDIFHYYAIPGNRDEVGNRIDKRRGVFLPISLGSGIDGA